MSEMRAVDYYKRAREILEIEEEAPQPPSAEYGLLLSVANSLMALLTFMGKDEAATDPKSEWAEVFPTSVRIVEELNLRRKAMSDSMTRNLKYDELDPEQVFNGIEKWLKRRRDAYVQSSYQWEAVDCLLDELRDDAVEGFLPWDRISNE